MRTLAWLLCCGLVGAVAAAEPPATQYGPRVTIESETDPLREVVAKLARQLNRQFGGPVLENEALASRPTALHLQQATMREALLALAETTGYRLNRQGRWRYQLTPSRTFVPEQRAFGDYRVALYYVRYNYDSYLYLGDPARDALTVRVMPFFHLYAPSDAEALRIQSIGPPTATAGGGTLAQVSSNRAVVTPENGDPSLWTCYSYVEAPPPGTELLEEISLPVVFYRSLRELVFEFDDPWNAATRARRQSGYTATVARQAGEPADDLVRFTVTGPVPSGFDEERVNALLRSHLWCEARFYRGDEPLFTTTTGSGANQKDGVWSSRWLAKLDDGETGRSATRLVVRFYVPGQVGEPILTTYSRVPLPPRQDKADAG